MSDEKHVRKAKWLADFVFRDINMKREQWTPVFPFNKWEELATELEKVHSRYPDSFVCSVYIKFNPYGDKVDEV